jgi:hypothetical protein
MSYLEKRNLKEKAEYEGLAYYPKEFELCYTQEAPSHCFSKKIVASDYQFRDYLLCVNENTNIE